MDAAGHNPQTKDIAMTELCVPRRGAIEILIALHDDTRGASGVRR